MPWGLVTVWWDLPDSTEPFHSLSIGIQIDGELPENSHLYIAAFGAGWLNDVPYYGGLQSAVQTPKSPNARIALFSHWQERSLSAIRESPGGMSVSSASEDGFISVRQYVPWHRGHYTARLTVIDHQPSPPASWVEMTITEDATLQRWNVGALRFPGTQLHLRPSIGVFAEMFGPAISPQDIPHLSVTFADIRVNERPVVIHHGLAVYNPLIPNYAEAEQHAAAVVTLRIGEPHDHSRLPMSNIGMWEQNLNW